MTKAVHRSSVTKAVHRSSVTKAVHMNAKTACSMACSLDVIVSWQLHLQYPMQGILHECH